MFLKFIIAKYNILKIGLLLDLKLPSLILGGDGLEWDNKVKYFGVVFNAGKNFLKMLMLTVGNL